MPRQGSDVEGDAWGSPGAAPRQTPTPGARPATGGGGGNGRRALWDRTSAARPTGGSGLGKEGGDEQDLWPSREAVSGPSPALSALAASPRAVPGAAGVTGGTAAFPGGPAGPAGLVAALRAAQSADRRASLEGGGLGAVRRTARPPQQLGPGDGDGESDGQQAEELVPYADLILKELGLPPRPKGRVRAAGVRGPSPSDDDGTGLAASGDHDRRAGRAGGRGARGGQAGFGSDADDEEEEDGSGGKEGRGGRGRGAKRGALRGLLAAYQRVWCKALDLELQEEWVESEERLKSWKRSRLEAEGAALFDLSCAPDHTLFRDAVLRFFVPGRPLPYHALGPGDIVLVSPNGRPSDSSLEGVVLDFSSRWIRVALPADQALGVQGGGWRLDLYANTIAHERARGAVQRFCQTAGESGSGGGGSDSDGEDGGSSRGGSTLLLRALAGGLPAATPLEQLAAAAPPWLRGKQGRERMTEARRVVAAAVDAAAVSATAADLPAAVATQGAAAAEGKSVPGGMPSGRASAGLNASQARAVEAALARSLTLWQGPPGTGKTATLLRFIAAARAALPRGLGPLLATAASNVAVDNLVAGLRATAPGLDVVRVGQPVKVAAELRGISLEARIASSPAGQRAAALRRKATGLRGSEAWSYISQALELEESAAREILSKADVVAATCIGCGEARMQALRFPVVVLDEATQATEPHSLVPLLGQVQQLVLVGDPQQLPPTVKSREAEQLGLGLPLFERLQLMGLSPLLLDTQYRMHPDIAAFPSAAFYGARLRSAPSPRDRRPPQAFPWPNPKVPVCFIPVRGVESRTAAANDGATPGGSTGFSYQNDLEASAVAGVVGALLAPGGGLRGPGDIGIITPYNGQVRCLQQLLTRGSRLPRSSAGGGAARPASFLRSSPALDDDDAPGAAAREDAVLEIKSVDGFQGREKEVIVFSAVRSNPDGRLGFVSDPRRLNVAITRAKRGLVVVGNPDTLSTDRLWTRWLRWVESRGCVMEERWDAALGGGGGGGGSGAAGGRPAGAGAGQRVRGRAADAAVNGGQDEGGDGEGEGDEEGFVLL
ncbi:hypothetical protein GPECTOR_51g737 [Gonium pectorale]|uniref:AAA+ ATPase domain-containing protein n=1 Tax=Gonium pectorale TaxID=33097 RepID=A0A150G7F3_GONPE|nr:hypothetical protein GPECTOR_51g737 [Gonium pectorale]|eukprot:KXZ45751.1 hypothetical protein GPECTOR_51g737 [Gonium pectorale]